MARLHGMILTNLVQTFEPYLKETAATSVGQESARRAGFFGNSSEKTV
jgi:hypothetical protein